MKILNIITFTYRVPRYLIRKLRESIRSFLWRNKMGLDYQLNKNALLGLKNKHKGKPCVLIGGGPSLNKMDLEQFSDLITVACNGFYLKHDFITGKYKPT